MYFDVGPQPARVAGRPGKLGQAAVTNRAVADCAVLKDPVESSK